MALPADVWLDVMAREYLGDFIPAGGGSVRFAVAGRFGARASRAQPAGAGWWPGGVADRSGIGPAAFAAERDIHCRCGLAVGAPFADPARNAGRRCRLSLA